MGGGGGGGGGDSGAARARQFGNLQTEAILLLNVGKNLQ